METKNEAVASSDHQMIDSKECLLCSNCGGNRQFDPTDVQLLDHLAAKCGKGNPRSTMLIDKFIIIINEEGGICYTHPEKLEGIKKDGINAHYFYKTINAYASGKRKLRKIQSEDSVRWHKTGKIKPVLENDVTKGYKQILILYTTASKCYKPVKSKWVMHQYHLGTEDDENEDEYVVSKVFYQQKNVKKVGNIIANEDSFHAVEDVSSPKEQEDSITENDINIDIIKTPAQEMEIIKNIHHASPSGSQSVIKTEFPSLFVGEICKPSSTFKEDISGIAGMTELENIGMETPVHSNLFEDVEFFLNGQYDWDDVVQT